MNKLKKRTIEDYEEIALDIFTARELLLHAGNIYARAAFVDKMLRIDSKLQLLNYRIGTEMEKDYPEVMSVNPFFDKRFDLKMQRDHIYSTYFQKGGGENDIGGRV